MKQGARGKAEMDAQILLGRAIKSGDIDAVSTALKKGASVDLPVSDVSDGQLPIPYAIERGEVDIAVILMEHRPDFSWPLRASNTEKTQPCSPEQPESNGGTQSSSTALLLVSKYLGHAVAHLIIWQSLRASGYLLSRVGNLPRETLMRIIDFVQLLALFHPDWRSSLSFRQNTILIAIVTIVTHQAVNGFGWLDQFSIIRSGRALLLSRHWSIISMRVLLRDAAQFFLDRATQESAAVMDVPQRSIYGGYYIGESFLKSHFKDERLAMVITKEISSRREPYEIALLSHLQQENFILSPFQTFLMSFWFTCAELGYNSVITHLLELGMPVNIGFPNTALVLAAKELRAEVVETILKWRTYWGKSSVRMTQCLDPDWATYDLRLALTAPLYKRTVIPFRDAYDQREDQFRTVQALLRSDAFHINPTDETPFRLAMQNCTLPVLKLLIQKLKISGKDYIDNVGNSLAHCAITSSRPDALEVLALLRELNCPLDTPDEKGYTPFLRSIQYEKIEIAQYLLAAGANHLATESDGQTAIQMLARCGPPEMIEFLLKLDNPKIDVNSVEKGSTPALISASKRLLERSTVTGMLLRSGADPNKHSSEGCTALTTALTHNHINGTDADRDQEETIRELLRYGADVTALCACVGRKLLLRWNEWKDVNLSSLACTSKSTLEVLRLLLNAEAEASVSGRCEKKKKSTLLVAASQFFMSDSCLPILFQYGARIEDTDENGRTCLHLLARQHGGADALEICVKYALQSRFDINIEDSFGETPFHIAFSEDSWMSNESYDFWSSHGQAGDDYRNAMGTFNSSQNLRTLLRAGGDPFRVNNNGCSILHLAAKAGNPRLVAFALRLVGPKVLSVFFDRAGRSVFHYAVKSTEVTNMLIRLCRTGVLQDSHIFTPHSYSPHLSLLHEDFIFLKSSSLWDRPDADGKAAFEYALIAGNIEVINAYVELFAELGRLEGLNGEDSESWIKLLQLFHPHIRLNTETGRVEKSLVSSKEDARNSMTDDENLVRIQTFVKSLREPRAV